MGEINKVFKLVGRTLFTVLLAGLISLLSLPTMSAQAFPFIGNSDNAGEVQNRDKASKAEELQNVGTRPFDERGNANIIQADKDNSVDKATVKRIQNKAEDLGNSQRPIGDTGLKNIKNLGENIPETIDRNFNNNPKEILGNVKDNVK